MTTVGSRSFQETNYNSQQLHHKEANIQEEREGKTQTTIDSNTNSFPASINRPGSENENEPKEAKNKGCNNIGGSLERDRNKQEQQQQQVAEWHKSFPAACDENRLIDSRSILTNKAKLKRYWERKMEMDFKLKLPAEQLQEQQQPRLENGHAKQQLVAIDENNNDQDLDDARHESSVAFSDEEWRSLSPNVDPRCVAGGNKLQRATSGGDAQPEHELLCRKLRQYQRESAEPAGINDNANCEAELMSLDPTLCHSEPEVSPAFVCLEGHEVRLSEREEQIANEEFSSSNSSFGPMSISMPARQLPVASLKLCSSSASSVRSEDEETPTQDEDEAESSAQSGSVLTVITKEDGEPEVEPSAGANNVDNKADSNAENQETDSEDRESNIGVAFESLQFDSEIKSSREEKVDESQFLSPTPAVAAKKQNGFTKREVNSVCNFITSAISDASRQVDSFMNRKQEAVGAIERCGLDDDDDSSTILRATFVESSPSQELSLEYAKSVDQQRPEVAAGSSPVNEPEQEEEEAPRTDLSSIFEANVRREIQRFESGGGAAGRRSSKAASGCRGNITEWRIAEEIRLFNERELELKQRHGSSSSNSSKQNSVSNLASNQPANQKRANQPTETVVRFGKSLQIPKAVPSSEAGAQQPSLHFTKAIKLTTSGPQQAPNMISMHKFISSGGKRFVLTSGPAANSNNNSSFLHQNHFTKSMSNLCSLSPNNFASAKANNNSQPSNRPVDYKAADSLNFKECPNVKPGITRKVIETFRRLNDVQQRGPSELSAASSKTTVSDTQGCQSGARHQLPGGLNSSGAGAQSNSAEFKIQEELREMRAREAELRSLRSNSIGGRGQLEQASGGLRGPSTRKSVDSNGEFEKTNSQTLDVNEDREEPGKLSYSSESLYPIKQTIDSFRKLNSAAQQSRVPTSKRQQDEQQMGDYEARVGGERRKISMIEKWENGIGSHS